MTLQPAQIEFDDQGRLVSTAFGDIYFQPEHSRAEAEYVFIRHGRTAEKIKTQQTVTIAELGFGTGLNFLLARACFDDHATAESRLHYISFEKHPITAEDLEKIHAYWPDLAVYASQLRANYPVLDAGVHRLSFNRGQVTLTLVFGDVINTLPNIDFGAGVDIWYLDGFAPAKNPAMWKDTLWPAMANATAPRGCVTTFTAAGTVRRGLTAAGFNMEKTRGYGRKRDMLTGQIERRISAASPPLPGYYQMPRVAAPAKNIAVIGAGIAGCTLADALTRHGHHVTLIDRHSKPAAETSGNTAGAVYPKLSAGDASADQLYRRAFAYSENLYRNLNDSSFTPCGVVIMDRDDQTATRHHKIAARGLPTDLVMHIPAEQAQDISGVPLSCDGLFIPRAGYVQPPHLCRALLKRAKDTGRFTPRFETIVKSVTTRSAGWVIHTDTADIMADTIIFANGTQLSSRPQTEWLPLESVHGQISHWPGNTISRALKTVICHKGYILPRIDGEHMIGATFDKGAATNTPATGRDHQRNFEQLRKFLPSLATDTDAPPTDGRRGTRIATPDRLPLCGPLIKYDDFIKTYAGLSQDATTQFTAAPDYHNGLWVCGALGSHGLTTAPLLAEIIASRLSNAPLPVENALLPYLLPQRFAVRDLIRKNIG